MGTQIGRSKHEAYDNIVFLCIFPPKLQIATPNCLVWFHTSDFLMFSGGYKSETLAWNELSYLVSTSFLWIKSDVNLINKSSNNQFKSDKQIFTIALNVQQTFHNIFGGINKFK